MIYCVCKCFVSTAANNSMGKVSPFIDNLDYKESKIDS